MQRLCSQHEILSVLARKRGRGVKPGPAVHDDHVQRDFGIDRPNALWFADITLHPTDEGKLYVCAIKDAFSGRIVGNSIDSRMKASLAVAALRNAIMLRSPIEQLRLAIVVWIERTYHRRRRQRRLGRLTPVEFEAIYTQAAAA